MGQKIHPIGFRIGIIRGWDSRWFTKKNFADCIYEDSRIRQFIGTQFKHASISAVEIERANKVHVIVNTGKPGLVIGKRGSGIEDLRKRLERLTGKAIKISVKEIKQPEMDAELVAQNIAEGLEKRVAFRRALRAAIDMHVRAAYAAGLDLDQHRLRPYLRHGIMLVYSNVALSVKYRCFHKNGFLL